MFRSAKALWLALLLNLAGVSTLGLGNASPNDYSQPLKWFGAGVFLSALALVLAHMSGMDSRGGGRSLEDTSLGGAPPRIARMMLGVFMGGVLAWGTFVMGGISVASLLKS